MELKFRQLIKISFVAFARQRAASHGGIVSYAPFFSREAAFGRRVLFAKEVSESHSSSSVGEVWSMRNDGAPSSSVQCFYEKVSISHEPFLARSSDASGSCINQILLPPTASNPFTEPAPRICPSTPLHEVSAPA
jgi:hypothetical protein